MCLLFLVLLSIVYIIEPFLLKETMSKVILFRMKRGTLRSTLFPYTTLFRSCREGVLVEARALREMTLTTLAHRSRDRKSTRLNSSHLVISYAVFCLKKKK